MQFLDAGNVSLRAGNNPLYCCSPVEKYYAICPIYDIGGTVSTGLNKDIKSSVNVRKFSCILEKNPRN